MWWTHKVSTRRVQCCFPLRVFGHHILCVHFLFSSFKFLFLFQFYNKIKYTYRFSWHFSSLLVSRLLFWMSPLMLFFYLFIRYLVSRFIVILVCWFFPFLCCVYHMAASAASSSLNWTTHLYTFIVQRSRQLDEYPISSENRFFKCEREFEYMHLRYWVHKSIKIVLQSQQNASQRLSAWMLRVCVCALRCWYSNCIPVAFVLRYYMILVHIRNEHRRNYKQPFICLICALCAIKYVCTNAY